MLLLTIYDGDFEPNLRVMTRVGVALFNDVIIRVARELKLPTVEMRHVCNEPGDFERRVEPSVREAEKVAAAVLDAVAQLGHQQSKGTGPTHNAGSGMKTAAGPSAADGRQDPLLRPCNKTYKA